MGQVHHLHRLAHVEHEQVAVAPERGRVEDQPGGLRDRHEEAGHVGVRDRRAARRSRAAPGRSARRCPWSPARCRTGRTTYGRPVRWAASATSISAIRLLAPITLVGRTALSVETNTKRSTPAASAASSIDHRAADVHVHGVGGMLLHHRHVLVGGGVEDHARRLVGDQPAHRLPARDVGEVHAQLAAALPAQPARLELPLDEVERALRAVDEHEPARARARRPGARARIRSTRRRR